ncbi:unnamed protein product [Sympodiomycopsis kandeliae]
MLHSDHVAKIYTTWSLTMASIVRSGTSRTASLLTRHANRPTKPAHLRSQSAWAAAVSAAQPSTITPPPPPPHHPHRSSSQSAPPTTKAGKSGSPFDPIPLIADDLNSLRTNIIGLLGAGHPSLDSVAKYYFQAEGKHIRPLIVLLMSAATRGISPIHSQGANAQEESDQTGIDEPLSPQSILNDLNPNLQASSTPSSSSSSSVVLPTQKRLAEISEMIHVASLLHDDVIDESSLRRGAPSSPSAFGNKLSILGGDFLLGRASVALARLRDNEVVELLATVISNLVEGEVMQMKGVDVGALHGSGLASFWSPQMADATPSQKTASSSSEQDNAGPTPEHFTSYLQKTYLKTASLMAKSSRAATILGGCGQDSLLSWSKTQTSTSQSTIASTLSHCASIRDAAYTYGRNIGIAFQLVDDLLDFKSTSQSFGKPSMGADLRLGLTTAPVLYAWQESSNKAEIKEMIERKFSHQGDVEKVITIVNQSNGLARTAQLARHHADLATQALQVLPDSEAKTALQRLVLGVLERVK